MTSASKPITLNALRRMKQREEAIPCLTSYDYSFACVADEAGVDVLLVGDSLGMVVQGHETTLPVTIEEMIYHTRCVSAGAGRALVMADMPFMSYPDTASALNSAGRLMKEGGAGMVKLEGAGNQAAIVEALAGAGIPVCAHLGLQPQLIHKIGGYKVQGREDAAAEAMVEDARAVEAAGADMLIVECIPASLGERLAHELRIPVIGIGAGPGCDGQILVLQDMLGITPGKPPRFARDFMADTASITGAIGAYVGAVRQRAFPSSEHTF